MNTIFNTWIRKILFGKGRNKNGAGQDYTFNYQDVMASVPNYLFVSKWEFGPIHQIIFGWDFLLKNIKSRIGKMIK